VEILPPKTEVDDKANNATKQSGNKSNCQKERNLAYKIIFRSVHAEMKAFKCLPLILRAV